VNVSDLATTLLRRWYLTLMALLLTAGGCLGVFSLVSPTYETTASVVLLPPKGGAARVSNPYLSLNGLSPVVDVLSGALNSRTVSDRVKAVASGTTYVIGQDQLSSAPVLKLTVTSADSAASERVLQFLLAQIPTKLTEIQQAVQVGADAAITSMPVAVDVRPTLVQKTRIRLTAAAGVVILAGSLILVAVLDGMLLARTGEPHRQGWRIGRRGKLSQTSADLPLPEQPATSAPTPPSPPVSVPSPDGSRPHPKSASRGPTATPDRTVAQRAAPPPAEDQPDSDSAVRVSVQPWVKSSAQVRTRSAAKDKPHGNSKRQQGTSR
jgi:hypothetical protein